MPTFSDYDILHAGYSASELRIAGYTIFDLKWGGYSNESILGAGYSASELRVADYTIADLKGAGYSTAAITGAGYSASDIVNEYSISALKTAMYPITNLQEVYTLSQLKQVYTLDELLPFYSATTLLETYSLTQLKAAYTTANYTPVQLLNSGFTILQLNSLFTVADFKSAGFTLLELKNNVSFSVLKAHYSLAEFNTAGFSLFELKDTGFTVHELKNDFTLSELKDGFTATELKDGFTVTELKNVFTLLELKDVFTLAELKTAFSLSELILFPVSELKPEFSLSDLKNSFTLLDLKDEFTLTELTTVYTSAELIQLYSTLSLSVPPVTIGVSSTFTTTVTGTMPVYWKWIFIDVSDTVTETSSGSNTFSTVIQPGTYMIQGSMDQVNWVISNTVVVVPPPSTPYIANGSLQSESSNVTDFPVQYIRWKFNDRLVSGQTSYTYNTLDAGSYVIETSYDNETYTASAPFVIPLASTSSVITLMDGSHYMLEGNIVASSIHDKDTIVQVTCGDSVSSIEANAFQHCTLLSLLTIPNVHTLGAYCFSGCTSLPTITLSILNIGEGCFMQCTSLHTLYFTTQLNLPSNEYVNTFDGCPLQHVYFQDINQSRYLSSGGVQLKQAIQTQSPSVQFYYTGTACFPAHTLVSVDQGEIPIAQITTSHTLRSKSMIITKCYDYLNLVHFEKDSLGDNIPSAPLTMSRAHGIYVNNEFIVAHKCVGRFKGVYEVPYTGIPLYNVLLDKYETVYVQNVLCETLTPNHALALSYTRR